MTLRGRHVTVVGAGLAGLAATLQLRGAGAEVTLLERTRLLGGKATSFRVAGVEVDNGQHVVLGCCTEFLGFLDALGMRDDLVLQRRFEVSVHDRWRTATLVADALPPPLHLARSFAGYRLLSAVDRVRVASGLLAARRERAPGGDMASWLARHGQTRTTRERFWDLFLVPALNAPLDQVAAADALFVVRTAFLSAAGAARIGWMRVPLARVAERAAARATTVSLRAAVTQVVHDGRTASALLTRDGGRQDLDLLVLAVPPHRLRGLLPDAHAMGLPGLEAFTTQPIVDVHCWYPVRQPVLGTAGFAALAGSSVQWVFEKTPGYLCASLSAAVASVSSPDAMVVARCHAELASAFPSLRRLQPLRAAVTRDADATFVPAPGLRRPGPRTSLANTVIAGAWTGTGWPATMESAVRSGAAAAAALEQMTGAARRTPELAHAV